MDRVTEIIERLEQLEDLVETIEPVMSHASDKGDGRAEVRSAVTISRNGTERAERVG